MARRRKPRPEETLLLAMAKGVAYLLIPMQGHHGDVAGIRNDINGAVQEIEARIEADDDERDDG